MPHHTAILLKPYIKLLLAGTKTLESRLSKSPIPPFNSVSAGDRIFFKASSGPFMATAIADRVEYFSNLTPRAVARLKIKYGAQIQADPEYWTLKRHARYATLIHLREIAPIDVGPPMSPSRGQAWFVFTRPMGVKLIRRIPPLTSENIMTHHTPKLSDYAPAAVVTSLIQTAKAEDMGAGNDDLTSRLLVPAELKTMAQMRSRAAGRLCGASLLEEIAKTYDPNIRVEILMHDGDELFKGSVVAKFHGPLRSILSMERVALNFCTRLSGVATLTQAYAKAIDGTKARIFDTRKTTPGLRYLEKFAVVCGGGKSHRMGLHDAVLVKDNHIAHIPLADLEAQLRKFVVTAKMSNPRPSFIEIEVDTIEQLRSVLSTGADMVLIDNMDIPTLKRAVALRDSLAPAVQLEASGGVNLQNVRSIAQTGVDRISVGAVTHSAPCLDLGLDIDPAT